MDTGSFLLLTALIILVVFIISRPFYSSTGAGQISGDSHENPADNSLSELMGEKERLLTALRDLDSDHDLEKVPDEVYNQQRSLLMLAATRNLKAIDEMEQDDGSDLPQGRNPGEHADPPVVSVEHDEIEDLIMERRRKRNEKSAGFCPQCGKALQKSDQFCPACGARVKSIQG
jgi:rubrerythrin